MKKQTKDDKCRDLYDAFKCMRDGKPVRRSMAKDGSIPTHSIVPVPDLIESCVLADCLRWLREHRIPCDRNNTGAGQMGASGFYSYGIKNGGDIIGWLPNGIHFEIECKRGKGGRLSKGQQKRMRDIRKTPAYYFVVHGVEELIHYFEGLI
jgi:hypothetical protein